MGLKTNKTTKTSTLNCQYVGSFSVKDGDKNLSISEQKKFVDAKLKNCTKKLLDGMQVFIQVSPDGIRVLASDEKTVKMAHTLRRVSYATVEPTNKIFAYVTHQTEGDMKVVCHTFITKKKDHAEGLSAALGKLFKQTFAYTLKRRDKLEEAVQKRGAGRRWAKQEVAEGHKNARNAKTKSLDASEVIRTDVTPKPVPQQTLNTDPASASKEDVKTRRRNPPDIPNRSTSPELQDPFTSTTATIHQSPSRQPQPVRSPILPPEWDTPFVSPSPSALNSNQPTSPFEDSTFTTSWSNESQQPPALPLRSHPYKTSSSSPWVSQEDVPPEIPSRDLKRRSSTPTSPQNGLPPALPNRNNSDSSIGSGSLATSGIPEEASRRNSGFERKLSAPDLMPSPTHPPQRPPRRSNSSDDSSTHPPNSRDMENAAAVLLATANDSPPPLPRKERHANQLPPEIAEEEIECEEDEALRREVHAEPRLSITLEDEDWYIPAVSREIVTEMLECSDIGTFLVRDSQSRPGCYALTMKVIKSENNPTGFGNYLIAPEGDGFALQGFDKTFPDISTLIRHYASYEDGLPCRLILAGSNPLFHDDNGYLVEFMDEEDEMYASLSSCTSMCQELNMNSPW